SAEDRAQLLTLVGRRDPYRNAIDSNMRSAFQIDSQLEGQLGSATTDHLAASDELVDLVSRGIAGEAVTATPQEASDAGNRAVATAFKLSEGTAPALNGLLNARIKSARSA